MRFKHLLMFAATSVATVFCLSCGKSIPKVSDAKEDFHVFVLMGDDFMSGRAAVNQNEINPYDEHIVMMDKDGNWIPAKFPLQFDSSDAAAGPGLWFARGYAEINKTVKIGLVPCACSGSVVAEWAAGATCKKTGTKPFDLAVERTKKAMADGTLKGVLWMQGLNEKSASGYAEKISRMISDFRNKTGVQELPFILSQMIMDPLPKAQTDINTALKELRDIKQRGSDKAFSLLSNREISPGSDGKFMDAGGLRDLDDRFLVGYLTVSGYEMFGDSESNK